MSLNFEIKHYTDLSLDEFHDIIALRIEIFAVEQQAIYNDLDGYDKNCFHLIGRNAEDKIIASARVLPPELKYPQASFGRVVLDKDYRKKGTGHIMIEVINEFILDKYPDAGIKISAMLYLEKFYEEHHFKRTSDIYLDCDIKHIDMEYSSVK